MPSPLPTHAPAYAVHLPSTPSTPTTHLSSTTITTNLRLTTIPGPKLPTPATALIRIRAIALNYSLVPCSNGAGTVISTGMASKRAAGDRVLLTPNQSWLQGENPRNFVFGAILGGGITEGTLQQYLLARDEDLIYASAHLSLEKAAAISTAGGTAVSALFHGPNAKGGTRVHARERVLKQGTGA